MKILVVGAGATGGYIGATLIRGGRDVTFLVRRPTLDRVLAQGIVVRRGEQESRDDVCAVTSDELDTSFDVVLLAVRSDAVGPAIESLNGAVASETSIVPVTNGVAHLEQLIEAFGRDAVLGATARLATSLLPGGRILEVAPGVRLQIGALGPGPDTDRVSRVAAAFDVDGISVSSSADIGKAMWVKFAFIASTAVLTYLAGDVIGPVARTPGGVALAGSVLAEVNAVAAAEGFPLGEAVTRELHDVLTDPDSRFAPSMFRDFRAGRPVEISVLADLATRARRHGVGTPLLDACVVALRLRELPSS